MIEFLVQLEEGCWIAYWSGDPGRTMSLGLAKPFETPQAAAGSLRYAKRFRKFENAKIVVRLEDGTLVDFSEYAVKS
jgi:hypothetical protein